MWLMPSFGRPQALRKLLEAPGGWPERVMVLVNADDPELPGYRQALEALVREHGAYATTLPWFLHVVPPGSRFCEAVRHAFEKHPNESHYGICDDDYWPVTPDWHKTMVEAAGPTGVAIANNKVNFPKPYCCRVMGGELARAIGTIAPGTMRHNYSDDAWFRFADEFGIYRPLEDVIVEHRHHLFDATVKVDATYARGSHDFDEDTERFKLWLNSEERLQQCQRVAKLLGRRITATDLSKVHLALLIPIQDTEVETRFHMSFHNTMAFLHKKGINATVYESMGGSHIGKARERVVWNAMYGHEDNGVPRCTHLLSIDADMGWEPEIILKLLCSDHDFCAAVGRKKIDEVKFCFNPIDPPTFHPVTGFAKAYHVGFAFAMLKRSVIDRLCEAYPELRYNTGSNKPEWALFLDMIWRHRGLAKDQFGERFSEDYSFCQRWQDIGGDIWIDPDAELIHVGTTEFKGRPRDILKPVEVTDAAA